MNEEEMWVKIWKWLAIIICTGIVSAAGCTANRHYQTRVLLENGGNPIAVGCAMMGGMADGNVACVIYATVEKGK